MLLQKSLLNWQRLDSMRHLAGHSVWLRHAWCDTAAVGSLRSSACLAFFL